MGKMSEEELAFRGQEVVRRIRKVQAAAKEAMENGDFPEATGVKGEKGLRIARAMMLLGLHPDQLAILFLGDAERVLREMTECADIMEEFIYGTLKEHKEDPDAHENRLKTLMAEAGVTELPGEDEGGVKVVRMPSPEAKEEGKFYMPGVETLQ